MASLALLLLCIVPFLRLVSAFYPKPFRLGGGLDCRSTRILSLPQNAATSLDNSMLLSIKNWWDDDLPNILGINPIEAAIIFGALYYFYGPTVLYDYAREAGKFFSTYAPVVRDVSTDIFYEFRDYMEEEKEREMLRKSGVDIDMMPRRTTNILERFQQSLEVNSRIAICII